METGLRWIHRVRALDIEEHDRIAWRLAGEWGLTRRDISDPKNDSMCLWCGMGVETSIILACAYLTFQLNLKQYHLFKECVWSCMYAHCRGGSRISPQWGSGGTMCHRHACGVGGDGTEGGGGVWGASPPQNVVYEVVFRDYEFLGDRPGLRKYCN